MLKTEDKYTGCSLKAVNHTFIFPKRANGIFQIGVVSDSPTDPFIPERKQ
jgi:hypothetical protein